MAFPFADIILHYLDSARDQLPATVAAAAEALNIPPDQKDAFDQSVQHLAAENRIIYSRQRDTMALPPPGSTVTGTYTQTMRGFGFVMPDQPNSHGDLFIPAQDNMDAITGDRVVARVVQQEKYGTGTGRTAGRIIEILKRNVRRCVGTLQREHKRWFVIPDGNVFRTPVSVEDPTAKSAHPGDKVVLELLRYAQGDQPAQGVITEVLGPHGEPEVELLSVLRKHDLPQQFPEDVLEQARAAAASFNPANADHREDLTGMTIVTIDPDDARDFDDAISLRVFDGATGKDLLADGVDAALQAIVQGEAAFELGVHIADVANFVPVESPLDMEARKRGNSVYFPRYVVPMLPEILSNGVCSLQEQQPRFTKSAFIRYDNRGNVLHERFANTVIRSAKRLTYREAQAVIDQAKGTGRPYTKGLLESPPDPNVPAVSTPVRELLLNMDRLARAIRQRRLDQGMIVLDLPEVELVMDDDGRVIDARPEDDAFTHKIIEMFMVEANEAVARFLTRHRMAVLRRVHAEPDDDSSAQVKLFVAAAGKKAPRKLDRHIIQELLDSVRGTPIAYAVHLSVLKTFSTAEYSPLELGHYALASENYAHFTSPIRRYADLVIHRGLDSILRAGQQQGHERHAAAPQLPPAPAATAEARDPATALMPPHLGNVPNYGLLLQLGKHLSFTERRAQDAERELRSVKVLQLLSEHVGDALAGVVTGVTGFGIFVQSTRFLVEGLIRISDLPDDFWQFDEQTGSLRGQRTGRRIKLGDRAMVQIVSVNVAARRLELRLLEHGPREAGADGLRKVEPRKSPKPRKWHDSDHREHGGQRKKADAKAVAAPGKSRGRRRKRR